MQVFVGLGSNEGDRLATLRSAVRAVDAIVSVRVVAASRVYETRPIGPSTEPYLNAAIQLEVDVAPEALLAELKRIEGEHGRVRSERWGSRTLDLDFLLAFDEGAVVYRDQPHLRLPHPEVFERDFVMQPLVDLGPDLSVDGRRVSQLLRALSEDARSILRALPDGLSPTA
jgi:2-amino-4-hydroxy-6-hydroxymethyldihydropteridine diphosphokinase